VELVADKFRTVEVEQTVLGRGLQRLWAKWPLMRRKHLADRGTPEGRNVNAGRLSPRKADADQAGRRYRERRRAAAWARSILAQVSRRVTVRLNTGFPGSLSRSTQK